MVRTGSYYSIVSNVSATKLFWRLNFLSFEVNMAYGDLMAY